MDSTNDPTPLLAQDTNGDLIPRQDLPQDIQDDVEQHIDDDISQPELTAGAELQVGSVIEPDILR
jgi:hypothetical protein